MYRYSVYVHAYSQTALQQHFYKDNIFITTILVGISTLISYVLYTNCVVYLCMYVRISTLIVLVTTANMEG